MCPFVRSLMSGIVAAALNDAAIAQVQPSTTAIGAPHGHEAPADLAPMSADPHDINGVYDHDVQEYLRQEARNPAPAPAAGAKPWGDALGDAQAHCVPAAEVGPRQYGWQVVQTPGRITLISEFNHVLRTVHMDRGFPDQIVPTYAGYSIGHWEGNTLVIETRGLKSAAMARSSAMATITRAVERVRKREDRRHLDIEAVIEGIDKAGVPMSVTLHNVVLWRNDLRLLEFSCEEGAGEFFNARGGS
jgi:hypothetical protein